MWFKSLWQSSIFDRWWPVEDRWYVLGSTAVMLVVLGGWDVAQWIAGLPMRFGTYAVTPSVFSEVNSWLPLSHRVAGGNLFPILPSVEPAAAGVGFFP